MSDYGEVISIKEAIETSRKILEKAEQERLKILEEEVLKSDRSNFNLIEQDMGKIIDALMEGLLFLEKLQWSDYDDLTAEACCPSCFNNYPNHDKNCELNNFLINSKKIIDEIIKKYQYEKKVKHQPFSFPLINK